MGALFLFMFETPRALRSGIAVCSASLAACCSRSVPLHRDHAIASGNREKRGSQPENLRTLFESGELWFDKADASKGLQSLAKMGRTAAYDALKLIGRRYF